MKRILSNAQLLFNYHTAESRSVRLNVYYLTPYRSLHILFNILTLGLFSPYHSAIEIDGIEYAFYGHPFHFSGVMSSTPNRNHMILAYSRIYGNTTLTNTDIEARAHSLAFSGNRYHLLNRNCNSFADALLVALTQHRLPAWINRPERCFQRIRCMHRLFSETEDISMRIVSALYIKSAGDQVAVFNLLEIADDGRLTTFYEVMLEDYISRGKVPHFDRLRQLSDRQVLDRLACIQNRFLCTFPDRQSLTLNKIFDGLFYLQQQLNRLQKSKCVSDS